MKKLKDMAEKLPIGAAQSKSPSLVSVSTCPASSDALTSPLNQLSSTMNRHERLSNGLNRIELTNGQNGISNWSPSRNKSSLMEAATRNGSQTTEVDPNNEGELVEHVESGVYITLASLPGGIKVLKRVRFSRKHFSEKQAEQWWSENQARVYEQYNVQMVDKSSAGIGDVDASHL